MCAVERDKITALNDDDDNDGGAVTVVPKAKMTKKDKSNHSNSRRTSANAT